VGGERWCGGHLDCDGGSVGWEWWKGWRRVVWVGEEGGAFEVVVAVQEGDKLAYLRVEGRFRGGLHFLRVGS